MSVEIRKALASDIDDLAAIETAVFPGDRISRRSFRALIERETAEALVAISGHRLVGYAIVLFRKGSGVARLYSIAAAPDFGGQGVGRLLLDAAETAAVVDDDVVTTGSVVGAVDADGVVRLHAATVPSAIASATTPPIAVRPPVMDEQG